MNNNKTKLTSFDVGGDKGRKLFFLGSNGVLESFARTELGDVGSSNLDLFAGLRIAALARGALHASGATRRTTGVCPATVTVTDTTPPQINCGQNETLDCDLAWDFTVPIISVSCLNPPVVPSPSLTDW